MGGVQTGAHAADLLQAGADLVAVGTESFRDPLAGDRISRELAALADRREIPANTQVTVK
jgi:dihydroorotate dehydrogenase (NAD+) catalytic subunit